MTRDQLLASLSELAMQAAYVHDQQTGTVLRTAIAEIKSLSTRELDFMALQFAVEEWMGGRYTDDELRNVATKAIGELTPRQQTGETE